MWKGKEETTGSKMGEGLMDKEREGGNHREKVGRGADG